MIAKETLDKLLTVDEIDKEIESRHQLISQMVGQLYPSILSDEIGQLLERKALLQERNTP